MCCPQFGCNVGVTSCPSLGLKDPVHNYMVSQREGQKSVAEGWACLHACWSSQRSSLVSCELAGKGCIETLGTGAHTPEAAGDVGRYKDRQADGQTVMGRQLCTKRGDGRKDSKTGRSGRLPASLNTLWHLSYSRNPTPWRACSPGLLFGQLHDGLHSGPDHEDVGLLVQLPRRTQVRPLSL
jgi:hypothetical protein